MYSTCISIPPVSVDKEYKLSDSARNNGWREDNIKFSLKLGGNKNENMVKKPY